jgi:hypothetical protein
MINFQKGSPQKQFQWGRRVANEVIAVLSADFNRRVHAIPNRRRHLECTNQELTFRHGCRSDYRKPLQLWTALQFGIREDVHSARNPGSRFLRQLNAFPIARMQNDPVGIMVAQRHLGDGAAQYVKVRIARGHNWSRVEGCCVGDESGEMALNARAVQQFVFLFQFQAVE